MRGKVLATSKLGYGFITSKELPFTRIFFHWTALKNKTLNFKDLRKGTEVDFELVEYQDLGPRAIKIEVVSIKEAKVERIK